MRAFHRNRSGTLGRVFRRVHAPAASSSAFDEARGHPHGLLADGSDAGLVDDFQSGLARIKRGNVWSAIQIAEGVVARIDGAGFKIKGTAARDPDCKRGAQLPAQVFADVQIGDTRPATEPLQESAYHQINHQAAHLERDRAGSLRYIYNHVRAAMV